MCFRPPLALGLGLVRVLLTPFTAVNWTTSIHTLDDPTAQARWEALWESSPQRSAFSSLPYIRAAVKAFRLQGELLLVSDGDRDEAGALVCWRRRGPYRVTMIPPFTQYSSLILRCSPRESDVHRGRDAFTPLLNALEARFHVLRFLCSNLPDTRPAGWNGWSVLPLYTYIIPLAEVDALFQSWSSSTRRAFRKHRASYRVTEEEGAAKAIVQLCQASYRRHGRDLPARPEDLLYLVEALQSAGMIRIFTARPRTGDACEAGVVVLHDNRTAHYWIAGSRPGPSMTVLLGEMLPLLHESGLERLDFVGANTPSIAEFKRQFGPVLTPYARFEKLSRPELRILACLLRS